jgi:hypothetical protein
MTTAISIRGNNDARFDATIFYSVAAIAIRPAVHVANADGIESPSTPDRVVQRWASDEERHRLLLRAFMARVWPEFDPAAAEEALGRAQAKTPAMASTLSSKTAARAALTQYVHAVHGAARYRMLASYTEDAQLKSLLMMLAHDKAHHIQLFERVYERHQAREKLSLGVRTDVVIAASQAASAQSFAPVQRWFDGRLPFTALGERAFARRTGEVTVAHYPFDECERLLVAVVSRESFAERAVFTARRKLSSWLAVGQGRVVA